MADPTKRTPTLEEYGNSVKVSAVDIRTVAIALPKVMATVATSSTAVFGITTDDTGGHTLDSGVRIKAKTNDGFITVAGATVDGSGYYLAEGDEVFIEVNQLNKVMMTRDGGNNLTVTYIAI